MYSGYIQCVSRQNKPVSVGHFPSHYVGRFMSRSPLSPHFYIQKPIPRTKTKNIFDLFLFPLFPLAIQYRICIFSVFAPCTPCPIALQPLSYSRYSLLYALPCPAFALQQLLLLLLPVLPEADPRGEGGLRRGRVTPHKNNHLLLRPLMRILIIKFHIAILPPLIFKHITPSSYLHTNET